MSIFVHLRGGGGRDGGQNWVNLVHIVVECPFILGFPTGRDSATFRDNGTEVSSLSRDKGTTGQGKNLAKGRDGPGQPKFGTGRAGTVKIRDGMRDKTGQKRKGRFKTGK